MGSTIGAAGDSFLTLSSFVSSFTDVLFSSVGSMTFFLRPLLAVTFSGNSIEVSPKASLSAKSKSILGSSRITSFVSMPLTAATAGVDLTGLFSAVLVLPLGPPLLRGRFGGLSGDLSNSGDGISYGTIIPSLL